MKPCVGCGRETPGTCGCGDGLCRSCWHTLAFNQWCFDKPRLDLLDTDPCGVALREHVGHPGASWNTDDSPVTFVAAIPQENP